jgi:DNA-binding response OmpR family regulator
MSKRKIRILVVDDNNVFRELLIRSFADENTEVLLAADGEEALRVAFAERPDAVLLDVSLPLLTGYEVCRALRQTPSTQTIPIIMLTVRDELDDKIEGMRCGADAYLTKPVDLGWLSKRLHTLLAKP